MYLKNTAGRESINKFAFVRCKAKALHCFLLLASLFLLLTSLFSSVYAQETSAEQLIKKDEFSFNFDDEDIYSAIQIIFGDILKVNYVIDPQVKGRVNLRTVTPVARKDILPLMETILKLNGIGVLEENNLYRIVPLSDISKGLIRPKVFVFPVQNSSAKHVASVLQQILLGIKPSAPPSVKSVAVTEETQSSPPQPQAAVEQRGGDAVVSDVTKIFHDEVTNTIIILSTQDDYAMISEIIKKIDVEPRQVLIDGLIARIDLSDSLKFGLAWSLKTDINFSLNPFTRDINLDGEMGQRPSDLAGEGGSPVTLSGTGFTFLATDASGIVRARLEALSSEGKANVIAAPHVLVLDNREARIQVGQQIPIQTVQTANTVTTTTVQYKDIGIILKVKPQVNESGLVFLEITQEVSSSATSLQDISEGVSPVINKTEASTYLVARDGETVIIGGLIREDTNKTGSGIPVLSKIPLLGYLFGSTTKSVDKIEIVILLTPRVIRNRAEASNVTSEYINKFKDTTKDKQIEEVLKEGSP